MAVELNRGNNTGIGSGGVGYIVVPKGIGIADYISRCYRERLVSMKMGVGYSNIHNVKITDEALAHIKFPEDDETLGSPVVWIREGFYNRPVIIGVLTKPKDSAQTTQGQQRIYQETAEQIAEVFLDALNNQLQISLLGSSKLPGHIIIRSQGNSDDTLELETDGTLQQSARVYDLKVGEEFNLTFSDGLKDLFTFTVDKEKFYIKDQFGNQVQLDQYGTLWRSKAVNVRGTEGDDALEPMVLGDTLVSVLSDLIDAIMNLKVTTPHGISGVPVNLTDFSTVRDKLGDILSKISKLE